MCKENGFNSDNVCVCVCVCIRGATAQHAAEVLSGIPLGAIITAALKGAARWHSV